MTKIFGISAFLAVGACIVACSSSGPESNPPSSVSAVTSAATANPNAGKVTCGSLECNLPAEICCIGFFGAAQYRCAAPSECTGLVAKASCDGPEDCSGSGRCCSGFPSGSQCKASCGRQEEDVCHENADCTGGKTCKECDTPGGGPKYNFCVANDSCPF